MRYYLLHLERTPTRRDATTCTPRPGAADPRGGRRPRAQSSLANNLGIAAYYAGRWDEAFELYRRSGELSGRAGDVVNVARAQNNEAEILSDQGRLDEASALFHEARRVWRAAQYPVGVALATSNLGRVAARAGRFDEALELLGEACTSFEALGSDALAQESAGRGAPSAWCSRGASRRHSSSCRACSRGRLRSAPRSRSSNGFTATPSCRRAGRTRRVRTSSGASSSPASLEADYELALTLEA